MKTDAGPKKIGGRKLKWLEEALLVLGILAFSGGIALLLYHFQDFFNVSLRSYGWLAGLYNRICGQHAEQRHYTCPGAGALKIRWWKCLLANLGGQVTACLSVDLSGHQIPFLVHPWFTNP
jgi:hypothetical protein